MYTTSRSCGQQSGEHFGYNSTLSQLVSRTPTQQETASLSKQRTLTPVSASILTVLSLSRGPFFQRAIVLIDNRYQTNPTFVVLGIIVSLTSTIAILPLFHGYWNLGRKVSLNPLEIARAFGAPLFDGLDGNVTLSDIEMERGDVGVKYGACERLDGEKVLRVEDVARVNIRAPWDGEIFG